MLSCIESFNNFRFLITEISKNKYSFKLFQDLNCLDLKTRKVNYFMPCYLDENKDKSYQ